MCVCVYVCVYVCMCVCVSSGPLLYAAMLPGVCVCVCVCVCVYVCVCMCVYVCVIPANRPSVGSFDPGGWQ